MLFYSISILFIKVVVALRNHIFENTINDPDLIVLMEIPCINSNLNSSDTIDRGHNV